MEPIWISEVKSIDDYEQARPEYRKQVMSSKDRRRVQVGDHLTLLFENRETVLYQIQEMMRIERVVKKENIQHEVDTYNRLIPGSGELSATLFLEYESESLRAIWLEKLLGLENHVWIQVGDNERRLAGFDTGQFSKNRISAVQYIKFQLSSADISEFPNGARIIVDHPHYQVEAAISRELLEELARDLA